jgi:lipid-A-disaccharide synthase
MKYYIISGERSGDLHASNLIKSLKKVDDHAQFRGMGGNLSEEVGLDLCVSYHQIALMGFLEVILGFKKVLHYLQVIKKDILNVKPDAVILVDFGGFNMRIAKFAKQNGIPVHYYIPPKVWAWNQKRAYQLKKYADQLYCILPFEIQFFKKYNINAVYVGNPLLDEIQQFKPHDFFYQKNDLSFQPIIALLPGSRVQEIHNMLEVMIQIISKFPQFQFVIAGVSSLDINLYAKAIQNGVKVIFDQTYDLLSHANVAIVTSGTATLETAIFKVPQIVVYKTNRFNYWIGKKLIKVNFISLVNLIAGREVVKELIQYDFNADLLYSHLQNLLSNPQAKVNVLLGYQDVLNEIGTQSASESTSQYIYQSLSRK